MHVVFPGGYGRYVMQKVLITGANGLLGRELARHFAAAAFTVLPLTHHDLDITDVKKIGAILEETRPDIIINAAVIISIDRCESEPDLAYTVNREGVRNILDALPRNGRAPVFVQMSSSEVFGRWNEGEYKKFGYREDEEPKPVSVYQKSKTEAEAIVQRFAAAHPEILKRWYIVRASWLFGKGRATFVEQFTRALRAREEITVAEDQWRSPTWTRDFAEALDSLLLRSRPNGIYHIANEVKPGEATVMDVIEDIRAFLGIPANEIRLKKVKLREFFKIPRAPSNVLLNTKLPKLRPWQEAVREYLSEMRLR